MSKSIRDLQKKSMLEMLHFNISSQPTHGIHDMREVNELRENGVTLYLQLHGERQPIPDVPAVYFIEGTGENINRIIQDVNAGIYEEFYLNFTTSLPRSLLEELAYGTASSGNASRITKVFDQYLGFISLEKNLFTTDTPDAFCMLNSSTSKEELVEGCLDSISLSLFSSLLTLGGQAPLIYAAGKGSSADMLGEKLEGRIKTYMLNFKTCYLGIDGADASVEDSLQRPYRNFDLAAPLKHSSTYNALVHDILTVKLNSVTLMGEDGPKMYDIDSRDNFWQRNAALPFPSVAENVDAALNQYKLDSQQISRGVALSQGGLEEQLNKSADIMSADELKMAIKVIPELTERKRIIDCHLQISTALLREIQCRNLGDFFHIEQDQSLQTKAKLLELIRSTDGNAQDKMRLFLVFYLEKITGNGFDLSKEELIVFENALREKGCDLRPLEHCKKYKSLKRMSSLQQQQQQQQQSRTSSDSTTSTGTANSNFFSNRLATGVLGNMLSSVKNLLPESADTPLTKLVEQAIESATGASTGAASALRNTFGGGSISPRDDQFTIFDPKTSRNRPGPVSTQRSAFNHLIVFIVGGATYAEYNHLEEYLRKKSSTIKMSLTFGSTEMLTGESFLSQMSQL